MLNELFSRFNKEFVNPDDDLVAALIPYSGYVGEPVLKPGGCIQRCRQCELTCPSQAIVTNTDRLSVEIDLGRCIFCGNCSRRCPDQSIRFTKNFRMSTTRREHLKISATSPLPPINPLDGEMRSYFNALKVRFVAAGDCGGCRLEMEDLLSPKYDLAARGISFVESPLQANALMVSGPVPPHMTDVVLATWNAMPEPKLYISVGACNISGGIFASAGMTGVPKGITPDLCIPGCPPHPATVLYGILEFLGNDNDTES